jgi:hypothetical protein
VWASSAAKARPDTPSAIATIDTSRNAMRMDRG